MKKFLPLLLLLVSAIIQKDTHAQSIAVTKTNTTKVYVHYMPWFTAPRNPVYGTNYTLNSTNSGNWGSHWSNVSPNSANTNDSTQITNYAGIPVYTRNICAHYHPLIGPYDGSDPNVLEYHLLLMKLSGIDGVMIDWYGQSGTNGDVGALLINSNALIAQSGSVGLKYGLVMEDNFWGTNINTYAIPNGNYAVNNYFNNSLYPNSTYITLGDMRGSGATNASAPLVCVFGPQHYQTQGQWNTILSGNINAFLPLYNQSASIGTDAAGEFAWPDPQAGQSGTPPSWYTNLSGYYAGGATTIHNRPSRNIVLGSAYAGFNDFYGAGGADNLGIIPRNFDQTNNSFVGGSPSTTSIDARTLKSTLTLCDNNKSILDGIQIATWNDYSEGTIIEPTVELGFASLDTIQKFTGVSYTEADLYQVYRLFTLRKQYAGNVTIQSELNQVFTYFIQLDIANAKALMDCIVNSGGVNCSTLPVINSATTDTVEAGSTLNYQITATTTNGPIIRYGASSLPAGFSIDTSTGIISGSSYAIGSYAVVDSATNASGTTYSALTITVKNPSTELPYNGTAANIPGVIQAEYYDLGGQGLAYNDADASNNGGAFRTAEGVDIETTSDAGGGYDVGWINAGEWIKYIINVTQSGTYTMTARVATGTAGTKQFHVVLDSTGNSITLGTLTVPATGGWQVWQTTAGITTPYLSVGTDTLLVYMDVTGFNINYLSFTINPTSTPLISSTLTDTGTVGTPFNYSISASNTPTSYNATNLPAGLSINTSTGIISGTPTTAGTKNVIISATNGIGTGNSSLTITINPLPPIISSSLTTTGMVGTAFNYHITGSSSPTSYTATNLPAGLTINTSTGVISGTPTSTGVTNVTITATNTGGTSPAQTLVITIAPAPNTDYLLPITGQRQPDGDIKIQWSVDSETAILQYQLFRSSDSIITSSYSIANATSNITNNYSSTATVYSLTDIPPSNDAVFYFIKATGSNGSVFYSDTVKVNKAQINIVYPNPVTTGVVYIPFNNTSANTYTLQLINAIGQPVYTVSNIIISGNTTYPLQIPGRIAPGVYQIRLTDAAGVRITYKIVVSR
jgi:carbohydrate binding protein with CBM6 domain/putative Ig domain-containing protein